MNDELMIIIVVGEQTYKTLNIDEFAHNSYGTHLVFRQVGHRGQTSVQTLRQVTITIPAKT